MIEERVEGLGRIVTGLVGVAWSVATSKAGEEMTNPTRTSHYAEFRVRLISYLIRFSGL